MTDFTRKLGDAAVDFVKHESPPRIKIGAELPGSRGRARAAEPLDTSHPAAASGPSVSARPFVDHATLERALERSGARIPTGDSARLVALAETRLAGRAVDSLNVAERQELVETLQREIARLCPGAERRQMQLREQIRANPRVKYGSDVRASSTTVEGGTWIFWHSPSPTSPVIWGESFVPTEPGTPLPKSRPHPNKAGVTGQVTWRSVDGRFSSNPPALPTKPRVARSGLDPQALEQAPELVLNEMRRARLAALEAAQKQLAPLPLLKAAPGTRRAGTRITKIETYAASVPDGEWDQLGVVEGVTGPETTRLPDSEMDKVLPRASELGPEFAGMARVHAFGPVLGDETLAFLAYAPHQAVNLLQVKTVEAFARWDAKRTGRLNIKAEVPVKVSQYVKYRRVGGTKYPFLRTVRYDFTIEPGTVVTAVLDITPDGKVATYVLP